MKRHFILHSNEQYSIKKHSSNQLFVHFISIMNENSDGSLCLDVDQTLWSISTAAATKPSQNTDSVTGDNRRRCREEAVVAPPSS